MPRHLLKKDGIWHYWRRVPKRFADVDPRAFVSVSLETRDLKRAEKLKPTIEREVEAFWVALIRGGSSDARERFQGAIERARLEGFEYKSAADIAGGDIRDLLARLNRLEEAVHAEGPVSREEVAVVEALAGGAVPPSLTLSTALEQFYALTRDRVRSKSEDQLRRWRAPRMKAVANLIGVIGDKAVAAVTRSDALAFRSWWVERVVEESLTANSANKDIGHLAQLVDTLNEKLELGLGKPFGGLRLADDDAGQRPPFPVDALRDVVMSPTALAGLNRDARLLVQALVETGMRPIEACGLEKADILLDEPIPHVKIRANGTRRLKTRYSERDIPLVGISLDAFRQAPEGFPRYVDRSSQLSAAVNKYLRENHLLPSEDHSLYSVRHTFQDRLTAAEMGDRMQADLMGHKFNRPRYGEGPTLEHKLEWLLRLAITPDDRA
ncbi:Phage integrase family protein [Faunimonas pinastri]|uniref:Phage integrase family protein n=1 Tax=Faunimonas pinastri TaxID=1855383 RepID=A0A1H9IB62_9HYPH|nr:DUF6538 domain-containing protein [Faunimonas pinastri]SEQ71817.1 Phage integrase family protein [Faunimonas pinastri]